ncbi:MAG: hypothetical protein Q8L52_03850 [bacterium]|nr:hypothetical protein [bacterium]
MKKVFRATVVAIMVGILPAVAMAQQVPQVSPTVATPAIPTFPSQVTDTDTNKPVTVRFVVGWNYAGNSFGSSIEPTPAFGASYEGATQIPGVTQNVISVWKWDKYRSKWQFWAPYISPEYLSGYARANGWCPLSQIHPGDAYWLHASKEFSVVQPQYYDPAFVLSNLANGSLVGGWNSIALPNRVTARELVNLASRNPPAPGKIGDGTVVSIWTWSAGTWSFYSPRLDEQGGLVRVAEYANGHGMRPLDAVEVGQGAWLNSSQQQNYGDLGECDGDNDQGGKG